ncbi:NmrA family NAD(P)-binding protein [Gordonia sp. NB41Y]|uniref:NmrA family NAD(P)-binding protein n=1 Tax=Gordonia sp. NB41Y TaxID=875808 RepID=UPI0006B15C19|nr:NmrA family NAD(P)-binding protein [Gordonia sp. NB41Y]KOY49806.1 quinone oxidoreductase [Gordonia sp. NB41Y]WLP89387.1 NmrA family NAD(P)-binding protein [Gordonia sp. NB41Y]
MTTYAVTGATGALGGLAVDALIARGVAPADIVAVVRNTAKARSLQSAGVTVRVADYTDPAALQTALTGVDRLLLVSSSEVGQRLPQHRNVIDAAVTAGVGLIAYTSLLRADSTPLALREEHLGTEKLLAASGIPTVLLRNGWYWENFLSGAQAALESGVLYGAGGDGKIAGAARADYAGAAAAALVTATGGEVYELAGSEHLDYAAIAAAITEATGTAVAYQNLTEADYAAALEKSGIPAQFAGFLAGTDTGITQGALDSESTALQTLVGRPSTPLVEVLRTALA